MLNDKLNEIMNLVMVDDYISALNEMKSALEEVRKLAIEQSGIRKVVINNCYGGFGLSSEAEKYLKEEIERIGSVYDLERDNPKLVEAVETLGKKVNTRFSDLIVVEIPDCLSWEIEEYDGVESLRTF